MKLKKQTSKTSGTRHQICLQKNLLTRYNRILKNLNNPYRSKGGRNNTGRITVRHQGGGCKKSNHILNYDNKIYGAVTLSTFYDAKRTSFVSLNFDLKNKIFFKTLSIKSVVPGSITISSLNLNEFRLGCRTLVSKLPTGSIINCLSNLDNTKSKYAKSAGVFCQILEKKFDKFKVRLPSGKISFLSNKYLASLGSISNSELKATVTGKAGRNRLRGIRPSVRGIAMNPVDHPHGGKSNKGKPPVTPWGLPTKNKPTVKKKKYE